MRGLKVNINTAKGLVWEEVIGHMRTTVKLLYPWYAVCNRGVGRNLLLSCSST